MNLDIKDLLNMKKALEQLIETNADKVNVEECKDLLSRVNSKIQKIEL